MWHYYKIKQLGGVIVPDKLIMSRCHAAAAMEEGANSKHYIYG